MPTSDIIPKCRICHNENNLIKPCDCYIHTQCYIHEIINSGHLRCPICNREFIKLKMGLITIAYLFEQYIMRIISGTLFLMPIFLCNMGMYEANIFDILTWYLIRTPIQKYMNFKSQIIAHLICLLIPIIVGNGNSLYLQYVNGIHVITSNIIHLSIILFHTILFILSNIVIILIVYFDVGYVMNIVCKLMNHITVQFELI